MSQKDRFKAGFIYENDEIRAIRKKESKIKKKIFFFFFFFFFFVETGSHYVTQAGLKIPELK